ncbi:Pleckstrin domain-containing protein [Cinnamomum micranthum f. kanehirae]|uniref:Pleckstrin domain-containing protein n=1 Tax=Cinnamomum micranthum f. kanehirae TaxID=337451 RepID=A0A3S3MIF9_9MAGN|nr:Pleckstrin domain-containing protein [Cinnamomum micranthum f. kanehirae]
MLEDQVAYLLQKYLGNYVKGLSKEALKISAWRGDVELTNMQLKPEALNALKLPVKVKAGFLGSVKIKVPWSRLGQEPVLVYLDRIFILVEPATQVEGSTEDSVQKAKKIRIREMEMRLLESRQQLKSEMNTSWLGSLINTIIGNLKLSITNIHIRYEDLESNPGHPFAAGITLARLSAVTIDDSGKETFVTGGSLDRIQKSVELERLALYLDSDISPWNVGKPWADLLPSEWSEVFEVESKSGEPAKTLPKEHCYILQPVTGNAKYAKMRPDESRSMGQPLQKAAVNLDDVTLCLSKDGYTDILKLADNFNAFNQRLKYAHYRPPVSVKSNPGLWWKYAYKVVSDQMKVASGKLSWEQVLRYARIRKRYISLYATLLKSDVNQLVVDDNKEIEELDHELDIDVILQWRMLAHKFVQQSTESDLYLRKQKAKTSWWPLGWTDQSSKDESETRHFSDEDWEQLNKIIGYKEGVDDQLLTTQERGNMLLTFLEIHMKHNASKLITKDQKSLAELSCEGTNCTVRLYPEAKVFDLKLGSYKLSSPRGILAEV